MKSKFYNTWSCTGFLTEGLVSVQAARGSHEDKEVKGFSNIKNVSFMSFGPSTNTWAKSMVPYEEICGVLIPHGEACSIQHYLSDPVTKYAPS